MKANGKTEHPHFKTQSYRPLERARRAKNLKIHITI